ncbi:MAG TPA: MATE family efflux transporter [Phycisphaerales bacterium]|nr:MATE family efflux transporter [Phycisphaerales bacterium]
MQHRSTTQEQNEQSAIEASREVAPGADDTEGAAIAPPTIKTGVIQSGKLAGLSMWRAIWVLAFPVLMQQLLFACVGLVDKMLAGRLPQDMVRPGLDAVGVGSYMAWLTGIAMSGLGVGGQVLIARGMGMGDRNLTHTALGRACTLSMIWGAAVSVIMLALVKPIASASGLSGQSEVFFSQYVFWIAVAMPFTGLMSVGEMCMYGAGETLAPSLIAMWVNVVNIITSWMFSGVEMKFGDFTLHNPFHFNMHVSGIALGTALSSVVGALLTFRKLRRGMKDLRLEYSSLGVDRDMIWRICRLGVPTFFEGMAMWGVNLFVLMFISRIEHIENVGSGLQGAHIIAVQWESFSFLPGFAIGIAAGALAGQNLGAGNAREASRAIVRCSMIACIIMGSLGLVFIFCGRWLTLFVSSDPIHLQHTPNLLRICGAIQVFFALSMVVRQGLRGAGDTFWTLVITSFSSYGIRLPLAYVLGVTFQLGLEGIWYGLCGELVIRGLLFTGRFVQGGWKRLAV